MVTKRKKQQREVAHTDSIAEAIAINKMEWDKMNLGEKPETD